MQSRILIVLAVAGCGFRAPAAAPGDGGEDALDSGPPLDSIDPDSGPPVDANPCRAVEVSAMSAHTCARMENGDVWCWGINKRGEIGLPSQSLCGGATPCNPTPQKLELPPVTKLGVAEEHACAIAGASVYCWGRDTDGQFGNGLLSDAITPLLVAERAGASEIGGGLAYGCSLRGDAVWCSGKNENGEVGDPTMMEHSTPFPTVASGARVIANGYQHACAIEGGFVYCWGANTSGQVDTHVGTAIYAPRMVQNIASATAIATGFEHTCAALTTGDLRCWGANGSGQLGVGDMQPHPDMVAAPTLTGVVELAAGSDHTCARTSAGSVYCWGEHYSPTPSQITLPHPAVSIAAGSYHDCFALDDGSVSCLGWNLYGQLGRGSADPSTTTAVSQVMLCH